MSNATGVVLTRMLLNSGADPNKRAQPDDSFLVDLNVSDYLNFLHYKLFEYEIAFKETLDLWNFQEDDNRWSPLNYDGGRTPLHLACVAISREQVKPCFFLFKFMRINND